MKNKKLRNFLIIVVPLAVILLAFMLPRGSKRSSGGIPGLLERSGRNLQEVLPSPFAKHESNDLPEGTYTVTNPPPLTPEKIAKLKLEPYLPISIEDFETSVGITTSISIFSLTMDSPDTVHLEINNIDLQNRDVNPETNPYVSAFKESFLKAKDELAKYDVVLDDLNFVYSMSAYQQVTAEYFIVTLGLK